MAVPLRHHKVIYQVDKTFHSSTNPEILVKIGLLASEKQVLESRPLKNNIYKNKQKNIGKIFSLFGMWADRAKNIDVLYTQLVSTSRLNESKEEIRPTELSQNCHWLYGYASIQALNSSS